MLAEHPALVEAGSILRRGGLVAFPTETVYGLGADARSAAAVEAIYVAKQRPGDNPVIVHIGSAHELESVTALAQAMRAQSPSTAPAIDGHAVIGSAAATQRGGSDWREHVPRLLDRYWPGPLTIVVPAAPELRAASRGLPTVAVRVPDHPVALALIAAAGCPIAAPSANLSGRPSPTRAAHVLADLDGRIDMVLDSGPCRIGIESTVLDLSGERSAVLRPGSIDTGAIAAVLCVAVADGDAASADGRASPQPPRSPGAAHRHYRPRASVVLMEGDLSAVAIERLVDALAARLSQQPTQGSIGYVATRSASSSGGLPDAIRRRLASGPQPIVIERRSSDLFAHHLYDDLRRLDDEGVGVVLIEAPGDVATEPITTAPAILDRLSRAASVVVDSDSDLVGAVDAIERLMVAAAQRP